MTEQPTIESILVLSSSTVELDFDEIRRIAGQAPHSIRLLGHRTAAGRVPPVRSSEWVLSSGAQVLDSIDDGVSQLLGRIAARSDLIARFCVECGCDVTVISRVCIYDWDDRPSIKLAPASVALLQQLGAAWQLDLADFSR